AGGVFRDRKLHRIAERGHPDLAAQHRLIERDGQIDPDVGTLDLEERMGCDADGDQEIAGRMALGGLALSPQPNLLALGDPGRNLDVALLAVRRPAALRATLARFSQRNGHGDVDVEVEPDPAGVELELRTAAGSGARAARRTAEHAVEDVLERA